MALEIEHESEGVQSMLEGLEAYLTAYCVAKNRRAIVIVREDTGFVFRRSIGPNGVTPIPVEFDDAVVVSRFVAQGSDADLLAMDATIAAAHANGERVVIVENGNE